MKSFALIMFCGDGCHIYLLVTKISIASILFFIRELFIYKKITNMSKIHVQLKNIFSPVECNRNTKSLNIIGPHAQMSLLKEVHM